jgi:glycine reductase
VVAGPAFAAGRYGSACAQVCRLAGERGIPAVTGMHPENPGVLVHKKAHVVPTSDSAGDMPRVLPLVLALGRKLVAGTAGPAGLEGYLPRGVRRPGLRDRPGAERAVDMLVAKLAGRPFVTEIPVDAYEAVSPAPALPALSRATIGLVVSSGIVPRGNPDHFRRCSETRWQRYDVAGLSTASPQGFECVHGGFFNQMATENPNLALPLDVARDLEREGVVGRVLDHYYATVGNDQRFLDCKRNGAEIAAALRRDGADGVLLVAT